MSIRFSFCLLAIIGVWIASCKKDKAPVDNSPCKPTYEANVKTIINTRCAIAGCHAQGSNLVDLSHYSSVRTRVDNGRIKANVFELKIMPPANATPLTGEEKETLKCWLDNGAPEK